LGRPWFVKPLLRRNTVACDDEGWSLTFSGSSWHMDRYEYSECGRTITFGGEGAAGRWDIFIPPQLAWDDARAEPLDDATRDRILKRVTAAIQWLGFSVGFLNAA
jgi:hypothetical protein